jgi:hypothetical protein
MEVVLKSPIAPLTAHYDPIQGESFRIFPPHNAGRMSPPTTFGRIVDSLEKLLRFYSLLSETAIV